MFPTRISLEEVVITDRIAEQAEAYTVHMYILINYLISRFGVLLCIFIF